MTRPFLRPEIVWPAAVVALLLAGIGSAFAVLFFSRIDGGAEVLDDYYRRGLAWDSSAVERAAVERFGWTITIDPAGVSDDRGMRLVRIGVADSVGNPVEGLPIRVRAFRPQFARAIAESPAAPTGVAGGYAVRLPVREAGLWDFEISGQWGEEPFVLRIRREIAP